MESMRDIDRAMEREIAKGSCPLRFVRIEFNNSPYQQIASKEKLFEVLSYLLRTGDYGRFAGKGTGNNVYMDIKGRKPTFKRTRSFIDRNNIFVTIRRYGKKLKPDFDGHTYLETVQCIFELPEEEQEKYRVTYDGQETFAFPMSDKYCGRELRCRGREASPYYCSGRNHEEENECQDIFIPRKKLEDAVLCQVRGMAAVLAEARADTKAEETGGRKAALEKTVSGCEKELRNLKEMKVRMYEQYKEGGITREEYLGQAGNVKERMAGLEQDRGRAQEELCRLLTAPKEELPDGELAEFAVLETFDKDRLKKLIKKVAVYGEDRIEIVWKVKNPFEKELSGGGMYL